MRRISEAEVRPSEDASSEVARLGEFSDGIDSCSSEGFLEDCCIQRREGGRGFWKRGKGGIKGVRRVEMVEVAVAGRKRGVVKARLDIVHKEGVCVCVCVCEMREWRWEGGRGKTE